MLENITFSYFAEQVVSHPALLIAVLQFHLGEMASTAVTTKFSPGCGAVTRSSRGRLL